MASTSGTATLSGNEAQRDVAETALKFIRRFV